MVWVSHFAGRACLIGGALVELSAVRVMSSEMVQCRVPVWQQVLGRADRRWPKVVGETGQIWVASHRQDVQNLSVAFSNDARDATKKWWSLFFVPSGARRKKEDIDVHKLNWRWNVGELQSYTIVDGKQIRGTRWVGSVSHYWHRSCTFIARISSINDSPESQK